MFDNPDANIRMAYIRELDDRQKRAKLDKDSEERVKLLNEMAQQVKLLPHEENEGCSLK
jgi:hypothetical protein